MDYEALGLRARLVWDGAGEVQIPPEMGTPRADQMKGTEAERLTELAGRVCYDSLGTGRDSAGYHQHIAEVGHGSVLEHFHFTVQFPPRASIPLACLNRPGLWLDREADGDRTTGWRVTTNLRAVAEWHHWTDPRVHRDYDPTGKVGETLRHFAYALAPRIIRQPGMLQLAAELVEPRGVQECWITLYLEGSRGFSHELVRHGDSTAISQRSTRYCDESAAQPVVHPLIARVDAALLPGERIALRKIREEGWQTGQECYRLLVEPLERWLVGTGADRATARKQARGAARGYLGNALPTALIVSASVRQWLWMLNQRGSAAADAEIRASACLWLRELKRSREGSFFAHLTLAPSPDGVGEIIQSR